MTSPMPVTVQPGVSALLALVKSDPDFGIDIKKGVLAEVVRRLMPKTLDELYLRTIKAEVEKARYGLLQMIGREGKTLEEVVQEEVVRAVEVIRTSSYTKPFPYSDPVRLRLSEAVRDSMMTLVREAVDRTMVSGADEAGNTPLQRVINARVAEMETRITGPISQRIEDEVAKRVDAAMECEIQRRVDERLHAIRTALA